MTGLISILQFSNDLFIPADIETISNGNCAIIIQTGSAKYANTSADCRYKNSIPKNLSLSNRFF